MTNQQAEWRVGIVSTGNHPRRGVDDLKDAMCEIFANGASNALSSKHMWVLCPLTCCFSFLKLNTKRILKSGWTEWEAVQCLEQNITVTIAKAVASIKHKLTKFQQFLQQIDPDSSVDIFSHTLRKTYQFFSSAFMWIFDSKKERSSSFNNIWVPLFRLKAVTNVQRFLHQS